MMVHGRLFSGMSTMVVMPPAAAADVAVSNPALLLGLDSQPAGRCCAFTVDLA